jgi:glucose-6-phosphate 1-dehydrogenase
MASAAPSPRQRRQSTQASAKGFTFLEGSWSIVVVGASGDLAKKKTYPALLKLFAGGLLPAKSTIIGTARSSYTNEAFREKLAPYLAKTGVDPSKIEAFSSGLLYRACGYTSTADYGRLSVELDAIESGLGGTQAHRVFYLAIPPSVFVEACGSIKGAAMSSTGTTRVVIEKPFGHDLESSEVLRSGLSALFEEEQMYRIDHYLGKEMVQNILSMRFANSIFEPLWSRHHIETVSITFKEDIGTQGRGGYFDNIGIIRDVMQNHLMQIMSIVAMDTPVSLDSEDIRDEKVRVLRCTRSIELDDVVLGQYIASEDGSQPGYLDDETITNKESNTPTFAQATLWVDNERWSGVPFILKCGKALRERKAEIRIQFKEKVPRLFNKVYRNELVMRVQPDMSIYIKTNLKQPGLSNTTTMGELDMTYSEAFADAYLPDAYERLILDVLMGHSENFVRDDELHVAWKIFTPLLQRIDTEGIVPIKYPFGTRGPVEADRRKGRLGYKRSVDYHWHGSL